MVILKRPNFFKAIRGCCLLARTFVQWYIRCILLMFLDTHVLLRALIYLLIPQDIKWEKQLWLWARQTNPSHGAAFSSNNNMRHYWLHRCKYNHQIKYSKSREGNGSHLQEWTPGYTKTLLRGYNYGKPTFDWPYTFKSLIGTFHPSLNYFDTNQLSSTLHGLYLRWGS